MPEFERILQQIAEHFKTPASKERVKLLARYDRQAEAFFKVELMKVLLSGPDEGSELWPEVTYDWDPTEENERKKKCDLVIRPREHENTEFVGLELKAFFVGMQRKREFVQNGDLYTIEENDSFTCSLSDPACLHDIAEDACRLCRSQALSKRICLAFTYGRKDLLSQQLIDGFTGNLKAKGNGVEPSFHADEVGDMENLEISLGDDLFLRIIAWEIVPAAQEQL